MTLAGSSGWRLLRILLHGKSSYGFIAGVILSFAFSISVILGTVGIMDGFEETLKLSLRRSSGDLLVFRREGYFHLDPSLTRKFQALGISQYSALAQTEGFLIFGETSKGVVIKGVDGPAFSNVSGLPLDFAPDEVMVGQELYQQLGLAKGQYVTLVFAHGGSNSLPLLKRFKVGGIVNHGIYKKDLRFVYLDRKVLSGLLGLGERVNMISLGLPLPSHLKNESVASGAYLENIKVMEKTLKAHLGPSFQVRPYWMEFDPLLEAVKVEKFTIGLILQLVVVISVFNVMAFIIFLNEKKSQEIFLFQALGVSKKKLSQVWLYLVFLIWVPSCLLAIFLASIFDWGLRHLPILKMPGDIYNLTRLSLKLGLGDYLLVFFLALFWVLLVIMAGLYRLKKKSILSGLRKEFA